MSGTQEPQTTYPRGLLVPKGQARFAQDQAPSEQSSQELLFTRASLVLAWATLLFGLLTAILTAWIVYETQSPVLFWDQWTVVNDLINSHGHPTLAQLWAQHNEHRIPLGRLASYADLLFFGGKNVSLLIEIYFLQTLETGLLIWMFQRYSGLSRIEVLTASGFFIFCMFCPIQIENFYWGFQVSFVLLPLCASLAIAAAVVHSDLASTRPQSPWFSGALLLSIAAALAAEFSLASGLFIWPILLLLGYALQMPRKTLCLIGCVGLAASTAFLWGFHSPGQHAKPMESLLHPIAVARYVRTYFAWTWDASVPTGSVFPSLAESSATLSVGIILVAFFRLLTGHSRFSKLQAFLIMNAVFAIVTATVTALGRINFGTGQAATSRYQTMALLFWGCLCGLVLIWRSRKLAGAARLVEVQVLVLLALLACGSRFNSAERDARAHQRRIAKAYSELFQNPSSPDARRILSPYPNLAEAFQYLRSHHMGPDLQDLNADRGQRSSNVGQ